MPTALPAAGDRIVGIGGQPLAGGAAAALQVLRADPAGKTLSLGLEGGATRTLLLRDRR